MKKNNGFTLIELLATIIILAGIALVAFPILLNTIKNSENKIDGVTEKLVINAAKLYVDDNLNEYPKTDGNIYCIPFSKLIEEKHLEKGILEAAGVDSNKKIVKLMVTNELNYSIVEKSDCENFNKFALGNKFNIDLGDGLLREFYVLEDGDLTKLNKIVDGIVYEEFEEVGTTGPGEVTLIMGSNLVEKIAYSNNGNNSQGPDNALTYLANYVSENNLKINLGLPTTMQLVRASGYTVYTSGSQLASWLYGGRSYWAMNKANVDGGMTVSLVGTIGSSYIGNSTGPGIRPIITISKDEL